MGNVNFKNALGTWVCKVSTFSELQNEKYNVLFLVFHTALWYTQTFDSYKKDHGKRFEDYMVEY